MIHEYLFRVWLLTSLFCALVATQEREGVLGNYTSAAVAIDALPCANIGADVLRTGGTAVDASIATLFCNGVFNAQSMGVGGGFLMTVYNREARQAFSLVAREMAPAHAHQDMFHGDGNLSRNGPNAGGIPGEIRGYQLAKERFGNPDVSWASLIQPTIDMCRFGITVSSTVAEVLEEEKEDIFNDPGMRDTFINPETNATWKEGDIYTRLNLAKTLERIAHNGPDEFYTGETARLFVRDLKEAGGNMTLEDLASYKAVWRDPISVALGRGHALYSVPPPGSGAVLAYILNILKNYSIESSDADRPVLYHRIAEAFKWAYAARTKLGDPADEDIADSVNELVSNLTSDSFALDTFYRINDTFTVNNFTYYGADFAPPPEDHGTTHASILAPNGDAVAVTSTINTHFGSRFLSPSTGILLNNEMDDFSFPNVTNAFGFPPSVNNYAKPFKRPLSSMSPTIVVDEETGQVRMVIGAAGGSRITTTTAMISLRTLWLDQNIRDSIDAPRMHHQLEPMVLNHGGLDQDILDFLESVGHEISQSEKTVSNGIERRDGRVYAKADDTRKESAGVDGF